MKNTMIHKGYAARIEFDAHDRIFFGRVAGIRDIVTFHGKTVDELEAAFKEAVDHYLATCAQLGDKPDRPCAFHPAFMPLSPRQPKPAARVSTNGLPTYWIKPRIWTRFSRQFNVVISIQLTPLSSLRFSTDRIGRCIS